MTSSVSAVPWTLEQTFDDPTVTNDDWFGQSVAIDANMVLIGGPYDDSSGTDVGQVHLFDAISGNLLRTFDDPTPTNMGQFGFSVGVQGNKVLIGAPYDQVSGHRAGQAHLFNAVNGNLLRTFDAPLPTAFSEFGRSVAIDGNNILIGARADGSQGAYVGKTYLFDAVGGALLHTFDDPTPTTGDRFGARVAINGNNVVIGAASDDTNGTDAGQAHLFDATSGNLLHSLAPPTPLAGDAFGFSVAIDGNNILIGAMGRHQAILFDAISGDLLQTFVNPDGSSTFARSVAIDGNNVLICSDDYGGSVGRAYLFNAVTGNLLQTFDDPAVAGGDRFGLSVAIDGGSILIGAPEGGQPGAGQAYLFTPEPATGVVAILGGMGLMLRRRRR